MKTLISYLIIAAVMLGSIPAFLNAEDDKIEIPMNEGNVWITEDGTKYFTCPVMQGESLVSEAKAYSVLNDVRYYHCCPPCQGPFRSNPEKFLTDFTLPGNVILVDDEGIKHFRDPVSGDEDILDKDTNYSEYNGFRYYFSTQKNAEEFSRSPAEFVETMK